VNTKLIKGSTSALLGEHIEAVRDALSKIPLAEVEGVVDVIRAAHGRGGHVYVMGNGGSASTATHFACDLSKATIVEGRSRLRVSSLSDNVALLTAWANDTSYDNVFAEQIRSLVNRLDVVVAISASGNSPNVLNGIDAAKDRGAITVGLVGCTGGELRYRVDVCVHVQNHDYGVVEDCHLVLEHAITASIKEGLLGD
jgi:D-sedoheptulose 7-phosphate isomerase